MAATLLEAEECIMSIDDDSLISPFLRRELESVVARNISLEKENQDLRQEVDRLKAQVSAFKAHDSERKSILWKKLQNSMDSPSTDQCFHLKPKVPEKVLAVEILKSVEGLSEPGSVNKNVPSRVPRPPPPPPPPPPPTPPPNLTVSTPLHKSLDNKSHYAAPVPPPLPKNMLVQAKTVFRVPEVMEFYRLLVRKDLHKENKTNPAGTAATVNPRNMIGEIENRSSHLLAIKLDVETQRELIVSLSRAIETAEFTDIADVEAFTRWLDSELSRLVDERAVLKHFPQWPEKKADALREAAFSYHDLKKLQSEVLSFKDTAKNPLVESLRKLQDLQDRLERSVNNLERLRDGTSKKYKEFNIPWKWMSEAGVIRQMKLSSLTLAKAYMRRVTKELQCNQSSQEDLLLQVARFAFRVHQFAGGFDMDTKNAFEELRMFVTGSSSCGK